MNLLISVPRFPFCASTVSMVHESSEPPYPDLRSQSQMLRDRQKEKLRGLFFNFSLIFLTKSTLGFLS